MYGHYGFAETTHASHSRRHFGNHTEACYVSDIQREFVLNKTNWKDDEHQREWIKRMNEGDAFHEKKMYKDEGYAHRDVQEEILKMGGVGKYDPEGKKAYGWNSLHIHHGSFVDKITNVGGYSFDDAFYYIDGHYYLKPDALAYARRNNLTYFQTGNLSIVAPKDQISNIPFRNPRLQSRETGYNNDSRSINENGYNDYYLHNPVYTKYASQTSTGQQIDRNGYVESSSDGPKVHCQTGRPYDSTKASNDQGYWVDPRDPVYRPL